MSSFSYLKMADSFKSIRHDVMENYIFAELVEIIFNGYRLNLHNIYSLFGSLLFFFIFLCIKISP